MCYFFENRARLEPEHNLKILNSDIYFDSTYPDDYIQPDASYFYGHLHQKVLAGRRERKIGADRSGVSGTPQTKSRINTFL